MGNRQLGSDEDLGFLDWDECFLIWHDFAIGWDVIPRFGYRMRYQSVLYGSHRIAGISLQVSVPDRMDTIGTQKVLMT
jgi:hypothetical protein